MKTLVVYDSVFGNTAKIAAKIAEGLETEAVHVDNVNDAMLEEADLIVIGSPTRAFKPTPKIIALVDNLTPARFGLAKLAAFDTRVNATSSKNLFMRFVDKMCYAAPWLQNKLTEKGFWVCEPPAGFFVEASEGPVQVGELDRAAAWAKSLPKD